MDDLLDNAIRMTPPGGSVIVRGSSVEGEVRIVVADTGPGFDAAFLPRAFDPFARDWRARSDGDGDADGLGLSIVRAIAQAHGGTATAENTRPGAEVTLVLR